MMQDILMLPAKLFLGKGIIDKKFPFLLSLYKKVYSLVAKNGEVKVNIPLGLKLLVSGKDCGLGMYLRTKGEFEPVETKLFLDSLKPGMTVLDIGANVGYYSVLASKMVGKNGKVYAFEPDPNNIRFLQKNILLNGCKNLEVVKQAVGGKDGQALLRVDRVNPGESSLVQTAEEGTMMIQMASLDSFVEKRKINHVDAIKMDIEGAEVEALKGAVNFLKRTKNIKLFIECNGNALTRFQTSVQELLDALKRIGFRIKTIINEYERKTYLFNKTNFDHNLNKVCYVGLIAEK